MKPKLLASVLIALFASDVSAQEAGILLGVRLGRSEGFLDGQAYRTIWILQQRGDITIVEIPWLLIPTPNGYRRVAVTTIHRGDSNSEEEIVIVPAPGPIPPEERSVDPGEHNCPVSFHRTVLSAGRQAVLLKTNSANSCGGHPEEEESTELLPTTDARERQIPFDQQLEALLSQPTARIAVPLSRDPLGPAIRKAIPGALRAFFAPKRTLVVVLTSDAIVIRPIRAGRVAQAGLRVPLRVAPGSLTNEEVVMAEWALPNELDYWSLAVGEFSARR